MFDLKLFNLGRFSNFWRPVSTRTIYILIFAPLLIVILVILRIQFSLVGYYWERISWNVDNFIVHTAYSTASIYDATIIAINSMRASIENIDIQEVSNLPTIQLRIEPSSLDKMLEAPTNKKKSKYYAAQLMYPDGSWRDVQYRLRGRNIWHWQPKKPSLRIKLKKKWPLNMQRHINLTIPEDRPMIGNYYGDLIAAKLGVLTHKTKFVRLFINSQPSGVYHWQTREDQSLLIANKRMSGPIFIGDSLGKKWHASQFEIAGDKKILKQIRPINTMVNAIYAPQNTERYRALWGILSKKKYASWVAVNHLTGSIHTDFNHNNLFYFDPTTGLLEPIISDMMGHGASLYPLYKYRVWKNFEPEYRVPLNERIYPLMQVALRDPTFYHMRNKILYDAIKGPGSQSQQISDLKKIFSRIDHDVYADLYKAALQNTFVGDYPIPYSNAQYEDAKIKLFDWIKRRENFLLNELLNTRVEISIEEQPINDRTFFLVEVNGHSAIHFDLTILKNKVFSDKSLNGTALFPEKENIILYPGVRDYLGSNWNLHTFGDKRHLVSGPQRYLFAVNGTDGKKIGHLLKNSFQHSLSGEGLPVVIKHVPKIEKLRYARIKSGLHAWQFDQKIEGQIQLGPGRVELTKDLIIRPNQSLSIAAGTEILLAKNVSIFSWGQIKMNGLPDQVITLKRLDPANAWGGLVIQGSKASGSELKYVILDGGSKTKHPRIMYSGMVSVHHANNVLIENSYFSNNILSDDTLHVVNSHANLENLTFKNCYSDCIDLDYASGKLKGLEIKNANNDGLDFMNSKFNVAEFKISNAGDKGISVGESSSLKLTRGVIKKSNTGIAVKDASKLIAERVKIHKNKIAVDVYIKHKLYGGPGKLSLFRTEFKANDVNLRTEEGSEVIFLDQAIPPKITGNGFVSTDKKRQ